MSVIQKTKEIINWLKSSFKSPSPHFIKQLVLKREGVSNGIWIETGTYLGDTTKYLSTFANKVYSIEPQLKLYERALKRFEKCKNIMLLNSTSEEALPKLLPTIKGTVNFWLDGHYSKGETYKGAIDCPLLYELDVIGKNLVNFTNLRIFIDDVRCFDSESPEYATYPSKYQIVDWCLRHNLSWYIEHDIFIISFK